MLTSQQVIDAIHGSYATGSKNGHQNVLALLDAMAAERDDLERYIDLFGTHPKYGVSGRKISSVTYCPQPYQRLQPLYERCRKV